MMQTALVEAIVHVRSSGVSAFNASAGK